MKNVMILGFLLLAGITVSSSQSKFRTTQIQDFYPDKIGLVYFDGTKFKSVNQILGGSFDSVNGILNVTGAVQRDTTEYFWITLDPAPVGLKVSKVPLGTHIEVFHNGQNLIPNKDFVQTGVDFFFQNPHQPVAGDIFKISYDY